MVHSLTPISNHVDPYVAVQHLAPFTVVLPDELAAYPVATVSKEDFPRLAFDVLSLSAPEGGNLSDQQTWIFALDSAGAPISNVPYGINSFTVSFTVAGDVVTIKAASTGVGDATNLVLQIYPRYYAPPSR